ncbi:MAG: bifunctional DNA-formamidopyrimidine glycosylase/DNA-(apurinic or apyrimidinic site) lyase [Pseudobdellovibrionaceae bacterium]
MSYQSVMPELPEVEVVRLQLQSQLTSKNQTVRLSSAIFARPDLRFVIPQIKIKQIIGQVLQGFRRHGKYLIFDFGEQKLISHFGMTGTWRILAPHHPKQIHDHVFLSFSVGQFENTIVYQDPRRFGFLDYEDHSIKSEFLARLGPDALLVLEIIPELEKKMKTRLTPIKNLLLDQGFIAGVGNIYASEALFLAGIHPLKSAKLIKRKKIEKLMTEIPRLLQTSIRLGGSSIDDFHGLDQKAGSYQNNFWVYDRENQPCLVCQKKIQFLKMGQRSTYYCSACQK